MAARQASMDPVTCEVAQVTRDDAAPRWVREVMLGSPKTLPADATVADARAFFANPKVVNAVMVDGTAFTGVLDRGDLPATAPGTAPARGYATRDVATLRPGQPMQDAIEILDATGAARLVVLADDGVTLAGLLCLDLRRAGFCRG